MKTLNILSFSLFLILHISIDLRSQEIPDHRTENYIPQDRDFSQFPLNLNSNTTNTWEQLHPTIPRVNYWGVYFIDTVTGFAVGEGGALIKTIDGGLTWRTIESGVTSLLRTIGSYDGSVIVAAGDLGKIIFSTDVGETWTELQSVVPHNLWNIQFVTDQIGWLVGLSSSALKTTDGGYTWINQQTPLNNYPYWDVSFYDTLIGYICSANGIVLRTTNGGANWDKQQTGIEHALYTVKAITSQKTVSMGATRHVYTSDGGNSWNTINLFVSGIEKVEFLDTLTGFAITPGGSFKSIDGGVNWSFLANNMGGGYDITFVDDRTGYLVSLLRVDKTVDSGQSWSRTIINDNFIDVFFTNDYDGWFIGTYFLTISSENLLYKTTDGGRTLTLQSDFPGSEPSSVYFLDSITGIIGARNSIYKSNDGGATWQERPITGMPGTASEFTRLVFIDENTGWALSTSVPGGRYVIKTTNSGESWQFQFQGGSLRGIHFRDSLNGWVTRSGNGVKPLKTTNGGETWVEQINFSFGDTWDVSFSDNLNGMIASFSNLHRTRDGGLTWTVIPDVVGFSYRFSNLLNNYIYIKGSNVVYKSSNSGQTWNNVIDLQNKDIQYLRQFYYTEKFDIAVGSVGLILRFIDSTIVGFGENPTIVLPEKLYLHQNYPNPFNTETAIEFVLPLPGHVKILIYDVTGRLVMELLNDELNPGGYKVIFNAERLSSGTYYYKLETEVYSETLKMVLIK